MLDISLTDILRQSEPIAEVLHIAQGIILRGAKASAAHTPTLHFATPRTFTPSPLSTTLCQASRRHHALAYACQSTLLTSTPASQCPVIIELVDSIIFRGTDDFLRVLWLAHDYFERCRYYNGVDWLGDRGYFFEISLPFRVRAACLLMMPESGAGIAIMVSKGISGDIDEGVPRFGKMVSRAEMMRIWRAWCAWVLWVKFHILWWYFE